MDKAATGEGSMGTENVAEDGPAQIHSRTYPAKSACGKIILR